MEHRSIYAFLSLSIDGGDFEWRMTSNHKNIESQHLRHYASAYHFPRQRCCTHSTSQSPSVLFSRFAVWPLTVKNVHLLLQWMQSQTQTHTHKLILYFSAAVYGSSFMFKCNRRLFAIYYYSENWAETQRKKKKKSFLPFNLYFYFSTFISCVIFFSADSALLFMISFFFF